jgi:hypothetical protein
VKKYQNLPFTGASHFAVITKSGIAKILAMTLAAKHLSENIKNPAFTVAAKHLA